MNISNLIFHIFLLSFSKLVDSYSLVAPTHLLVTRVGPCYGTPPTSVSVSEMVLNRELYDSSLSGMLNISEDIENGWSVKATMQKCHDIRNLDTCDFFKSFLVVRQGCSDSDDEDLYNMFFHYVQPRLDCPLLAGSYKISDFPFFTEDSDLTAAESKISTSVFGYTYRLEGFDVQEDKVLCVDAYLQLLYIREHDWLGGKTVTSKNTSAAAAPPADDNQDESEVDVADNQENDVNVDVPGSDDNEKEGNNDAADDPPADDTPSEGPSADDIPAENTPEEETPAEDPPADDTPSEGPSVDDTPAVDTPAEDVPAEDTPADETPADDPPANDDTPADGDTPAEDIPAADIPADDTPSEDPSADDTPADGTPDDDTPADTDTGVDEDTQ